jgi:DHA3 family macrolide efflux protein-like MFS transporter
MESQSSWKKHTIFFLASQNISLFGSMLVQYAIMWHITLTTQSGTMMMISIICGFIPTLIISPFAVCWAGRLERKKVIILSDAMIAITTLAMAISFYFGFESLWQLFVVMAIRSFGNGTQTPAVSALLPQLVPNEQLTKVNGIQQSIQACVSIISPILSGALLSITPIEQIFGIDVLTAALAIGILLFLLKIPTQKRINGTIKVSYSPTFVMGSSISITMILLKRSLYFAHSSLFWSLP